MKRLFTEIISSKFSMLVLFALIIAISAATFVENRYDTNTAKLLFYNTKWFELLFVLLIALYFGIAVQKKLFSKTKIPQLIFHLAFLFMIIGGGVTRYFGFEADMHIVEDESVSELYSYEPYINLRIPSEDIEYSSDSPIYFSQIEDNSFSIEFNIENKEKIEVVFKDYILGLEDSKTQEQDEIILDVFYKNNKSEISLIYDNSKYVQLYNKIMIDEFEIELSYGPKILELPFEIKLNKFTLSKYPGTNFPSASESDVTIIDKRNNLRENHILAKNKVLDYDGYRFFQTSYDDNESGTILSVNYDYYGTRITYFGYLLLVIGSFLILFSRNSKYSQLNKKIKEVRAKRKSLLLTIILLIGFNTLGFSQNTVQNPINKEHSESFGNLIVQNYDGRFSSVHSLALDVIHKTTGKNKFEIEGKGEMDAIQVFIDILVDPDYWRNQKIININNKSLGDIIGIEGKYASFNDFFENNSYKLEKYAQDAFRKKASEQTKFDKEIIKVSERVNVFRMTTMGTLLKIFPEQASINNKWISWNDSLAFVPLSGELLLINEDLQLQEYNYSNIMRSYLISTIYARESNDYTIPNKLLAIIGNIQRQLTPNELIPSENKIKLEIFYNKSKIFDFLKYIYLFLGLVLLTLSFIRDFGIKSSKKLELSIKIFSALIIFSFAYQTIGMIFRWYLSGHAPWSNGYEVLLFTAWGSIFAGLLVIKQSKLTLAATSLLTSLILMIAGLSYYDPQLTNLTPVLKSYWLIIHVGVITIGYSFLALSFVLGITNLIIKVSSSKSKAEISSLIIEELTYLNEKFLTIGLLLTAIGTFLGGVWANESWGRYWGWDPKETWSLIIVLVYGVVLHLKYIPKLNSFLIFNIASIISFFTVIMTFIGLNYYFKKGLHSYASDDPPIFPMWAWLVIVLLLLLIAINIIKESTQIKRVN